jgi:uncharacterized protein
MRIVIDTNVLLTCAHPRSSATKLFHSLIKGDVTLCISHDILLEYREIFERQGGYLAKDFINEIIYYLPKIEYAKIHYRWNLIINDPDDNKFVDCAIAANADFIITEDKHFEILKTIYFPIVNIITVKEFIDQYLN